MVFVCVILGATPSFAQFAGAHVDVRPFVLAADEHVAAQTTFKATVGTGTEAFWGGGVDVVLLKRFFVDVSISHMSASGQRAFISNGTVFPLGIPLRVSLTPVEITGGYRFRFRRWRVIPYVGAGIGSYGYSESSDFAAAGENTDLRHAGLVLTGGAEFRVTSWVGITGDAQYTHVPGIFGQGGISQQAGEDDLGGVAARLRVILGR